MSMLTDLFIDNPSKEFLN